MAGDTDEGFLQLGEWRGGVGHRLGPLYLGWTTRLSRAINARYGAVHLCEGAAGRKGNKW